MADFEVLTPGGHQHLIDRIEERLDLKADTDGYYYPSLSVGRADALTGADETAQWATRVITGSGATTVRSVQGATVVWNQMVINGNFGSVAYWLGRESEISVADGVATVTPNSDGAFRGLMQSSDTQIGNSVIGHKYFISVDFKCNESSNLQLSCSGANAVGITITAVDTWSHCAVVWVPQVVVGLRFYALSPNTFTTAARMQFKNAKLFDLTLMFGAGNEPATVAEFERMFPEPYYPYSAPTLKPVQIAGIASTDAQGGELDSVEWTAFTLRGASTIGDMLYSDHVETRVGVVDLGTLTWVYNSQWECFAGNIGAVAPTAKQTFKGTCAKYPFVGGYQNLTDKSCGYIYNTYAAVRDTDYGTDIVAFKAAMSGVLLFYELATPTTTPISPALPMSYKVERGGTESIIVPEGEVSAAPVLTVTEGESAADVVMDALSAIATPDGSTATANHAVGTYLTMGGKLYKVTTAIAAGETIAAGTNVTQTTVMDELIALTA